MSKLMPCDLCKELHDAIELEQIGPAIVACEQCKQWLHINAKDARDAGRSVIREYEKEIMRSRGEI